MQETTERIAATNLALAQTNCAETHQTTQGNTRVKYNFPNNNSCLEKLPMLHTQGNWKAQRIQIMVAPTSYLFYWCNRSGAADALDPNEPYQMIQAINGKESAQYFQGEGKTNLRR